MFKYSKRKKGAVSEIPAYGRREFLLLQAKCFKLRVKGGFVLSTGEDTNASFISFPAL